MSLEGERRGKVVDADGPGEDPTNGSGRVASDRSHQRRTTHHTHPIEKSPHRGVAGGRRSGTGRSLAHHERAPFASQGPGRHLVDEIRTGELVEGGLHRRSEARLHDQLLVEAAPASSLRRAGDPPLVVLPDPRVERREARILGSERRIGRTRTLDGRP